MRLTIDEYCKHFKMSKEMINSKIKAKKLNYIMENGITYITFPEDSLNREKEVAKETTKLIKPKTTVATVLALYQKENNALKNKIIQLELKIDKLIDDKEQMLRDERDKIEQLYSKKDEQLKNILELINSKIELEREKTTLHEVETFNHEKKTEITYNTDTIELKKYLKSLGIKASQRKIIKKRFLDIYDSDTRIMQKNGKLYLNFSKYDYSDLLAK
ncbi:MAG: hypothetical protein L3J10_08255 [Sulfurimonas sp.]|nr:hypothetical protein [Sulfurimonas sp.]